MLMFFIYKNLRSISKDKILLGLLKDSPDLRMHLGFDHVPYIFKFLDSKLILKINFI